METKWLYLCDEHTTKWDKSTFKPDEGTRCSIGGLEHRCPNPATAAVRHLVSS